VPKEHLIRFNGIQGTAQSLTMFAAPMAAGALLSFMPLEHIFLIDITTAIIGITTIFFFVKVSGTPNQKEHKTGIKAYYQDMKEGLQYIVSLPWLKTIFIFTAIFGILVAPTATLTPLQTARTFGDDVWRLSAIDIAFSLGMVGGGVIISAWGGFKNKAHSMIIAWMLFGVSSVLFGVVPNFWVYLGIMMFCGSTMPLFSTPSMTIMQTKISPDVMGRVFSISAMINALFMPIGTLLFGPLGDIIKIEYLLITTGILLVLGSFVLFTRKEVIEVGKKD